MNMVIPNAAKAFMVDAIFRTTNVDEEFYLFLFQNNVTVANGSTFGSFSPATFTGGDGIPIARSSFNAAGVVSNVGQITRTVAPAWTCSGGSSQTVYGWILVGVDSEIVYCGQNFDTPRVMSPGTTLTLDPFTIKLKTFD